MITLVDGPAAGRQVDAPVDSQAIWAPVSIFDPKFPIYMGGPIMTFPDHHWRFEYVQQGVEWRWTRKGERFVVFDRFPDGRKNDESTYRFVRQGVGKWSR